MHDPDQIPKSISQARKFKNDSQNNKKDVKTEIARRLKTKAQKHSNLKRKRLTTTLKSLMAEPLAFAESVHNIDPSVSASKLKMATQFVQYAALLEGRDIIRVWNKDDVDQAVNYRVLKRRKTQGPPKFKSLFWYNNETVDEADNYDFYLHEFLADMLSGDAWLL